MQKVDFYTKSVYINKFIRICGYQVVSLLKEDVNYLFFLLARLEEFETTTMHNNHNWELYFSSLERRRNSLQPVIEKLFVEWMRNQKIKSIDSEKKWPNGKSFALCLTHDIDILHADAFKYTSRSLRTILQAPGRQKFFILGRIVKYWASALKISAQSDISSLNDWVSLESSYNFKSTMHFMANNVDMKWDNGYYYLDDLIGYKGRKESIVNIISDVNNKGWDIGIHGGTGSSASSKIFSEQKRYIEEKCDCKIISTRQHHLNYDIRVTPSIHLKSEIKIDSSLGSNQDVAFRCGTGMPYFVFDLKSAQETDLIELPLIIQDVALERICAGDEKLMVKTAMDLINEAKQMNSCITLLWHNHFPKNSLQYRVYSEILRQAHELGAWGCSMKEINNWFRGRCANTNK
jgi:hypothetical protein